MTDLVVVVPSRGRPRRAGELVRAFEQTCTADTCLVFALDDDDPTRHDYPHLNEVHGLAYGLSVGASRNMNEALQGAVLTSMADTFAVGFMGDDHRPRTRGWDEAYLVALRELGTGIVYGDDLLQGERLPTQCAMTADIVRTLGYMAPPSLMHMYLDNFWLSLGREADCIRYLPGVVVEHVHPLARKAAWDAGYARVNAQGVYDRDEAALRAYVDDGEFAVDVAKVRALRAAHV
jgi:hypothetical protein